MNACEQTYAESLNYTAVIEPSNNDTVASASWEIIPGGPKISVPSNVGATSTARVSSIRAGIVYILTCHITGLSGQKYDGSQEIVGVMRHR